MLAAAPWLVFPGSVSHASAVDTSVNNTGESKIPMPWSFFYISGKKKKTKRPSGNCQLQIVMGAMQGNKQRAETENIRGGVRQILEVISEFPFEQVTFKLRLQE